MKGLRLAKGLFLLAGTFNFGVSLWIWFYYEFMFSVLMKLPVPDSIYFEMMLRGFLACVMTFGVGYIWVGLRPEDNRDLCLLSCLAKAGWPVIYLYYCVRYDFFQYGGNPVLLLWPALYDLAFLPFFIYVFLRIKKEGGESAPM